MECYPIFTKNTLVDVVVDSDFIDFLPFPQPRMLIYVISLYGVYDPIVTLDNYCSSKAIDLEMNQSLVL